MMCPVCIGTGKLRWSICPLCHGAGQLPDDRINNPMCVACIGTGKLGDGLCPVCGGWGRLPSDEVVSHHEETGPVVTFVEAGTPRTAHLNIEVLLRGVSGDVCVCDPYYGTGTLHRLDLLVHCTSVRFLTRCPDSGEKAFIDRAITEFRRERPHIEFRKHQGTDLHDRYLLTSDELVLIGHGLKDLGRKDSFVVRLGKELAEDVMVGVRVSFDKKWANAMPIP